MEIAIQEIAVTLNVTLNPKSGWAHILEREFEPAINALPATTDDERKRKKGLQQVRAHLHAVRLAWRNDTMHPKDMYTGEQAREILDHVGTFMRSLAAVI
jgi:hypothetical protein